MEPVVANYNLQALLTIIMCSLGSMDLHIAKRCAEEPDFPASRDLLQAANEIMTTQALEFPATIEDAVLLYSDLVAFFEAQM